MYFFRIENTWRVKHFFIYIFENIQNIYFFNWQKILIKNGVNIFQNSLIYFYFYPFLHSEIYFIYVRKNYKYVFILFKKYIYKFLFILFKKYIYKFLFILFKKYIYTFLFLAVWMYQ